MRKMKGGWESGWVGKWVGGRERGWWRRQTEDDVECDVVEYVGFSRFSVKW